MTKSLYGSLDTPTVEVPHGQLSLHAHPSLNGLNVGLGLDGGVNFDSPDWKFGVAPLHFSLSAPKLLRGDGLHLLRGDDGEIGVSFDKKSSRHFFFIGFALPSPKFSLGLKVLMLYCTIFDFYSKFTILQLDGSTRVEFNKEKGFLALLDKSGKPKLVYSAPAVVLSTNKTISPQLEWDASSSSLSISLPDTAFPLVIAFGLGVKVPEVGGGFGLKLKFGDKGEVEASSSSSESESGSKKPKTKFKVNLTIITIITEFEINN